LTTRKSGVESFTNARTDTPTGKEVNKLFTLFYLALHIVFDALPMIQTDALVV
jgi:hypothetical protein